MERSFDAVYVNGTNIQELSNKLEKLVSTQPVLSILYAILVTGPPPLVAPKVNVITTPLYLLCFPTTSDVGGDGTAKLYL